MVLTMHNSVKYELVSSGEKHICTRKVLLVKCILLVAVISIILITSATIYYTLRYVKAKTEATHPTTHKYGSVEAEQHRLNEYGKSFKKLKDSYHVQSLVNITPLTGKAVTEYGAEEQQVKLVCYYSFPQNVDLKPKDIDPSLCTHINIASIGIKDEKLEPISNKAKDIIESVIALKTNNRDLKVLLCVGGDSRGFSAMVSNHVSRKRFIKDLLSTLTNFSFDGVDFDWEFPAWYSETIERSRFVKFLKQLHGAINKNNLHIIVSVAVGAPKPIVDGSYDIPEMARYVDYINLMTYDFHFYEWYLPITGANAPLYRRPDETGYFSTLNTNWSANYWHAKGMPKDKIIVGVPTYGHSFRLVNPDNHGWAAPASGNGETGSGGFVSYPEVCHFLQLLGSRYEFDRNSEVPYAFKDWEWISYDDVRSVAYKAQYVVNNSFGGVMVFSLNQDDYGGSCAGTTFLLSRQIKNILINDQLIHFK